ncbi:MAG TPA: acetylxylan esterase [Vicinamibacterales bacterium]|nr:acetylxylan esterase [Vicinamibacterales bacterium]
MKCTRRRFIGSTAFVVGAAGLQGCGDDAGQGEAPRRPSAAPGVTLNADGAALPDYSHDLERYLERVANEARERRTHIVNAISTRQQVVDRQKAVVAELWKMLGGPHERTPLNARVTGILERSGYRIEKLTFESRPRLYVTANLYVPVGTGRRPAILGPLGHSANGKAWPSYQRLFVNLARKGYVVLAYDPFGQGERIEYPGPHPGQSAIGDGGTAEHEYAGRRLILLGANFSLFRVWDGIRGIDYLLTRAEVDPERIGCCGQSGGGTLTQFLSALDSRISVAVVSEGNTENLAQDNVEPPGSADDAEQNIVPALARGIDRADLLYAFAPKPLLMTVTLHDAGHTYSPEYVTNSLDFLDEYKRVYGLFRAGDRVSLQATTVQHGYVYEMRRATYAWFNRWFEMKDADDNETSQAVEQESTLYVTPSGFVRTSLHGETALSLTRQMAEAIRAPTPLAPNHVPGRIRTVLGIDDSRRDPLAGRVAATITRQGYRAEQFEFTSEREIRTPGWLLTPDDLQPLTPTLLYIGEAAAWAAVVEDSLAVRLCVDEHCRVAVIDVRGRGDCAIAYPRRGRFYFPDRILDESYLTWFTLMLGKPLLGGQIYDTLRALDYLRSRPGVGDKVSLIGDGPHGLIALYAAALDPRTAGVALRHTVTDYRSLAVAERYNQPFGVYAYGVVREFDLPDVARAVGPRPVLLLDAVTALGEPAGAAAQDLYRSASNVSVRNIDASADPTPLIAAWAWGRA